MLSPFRLSSASLLCALAYLSAGSARAQVTVGYNTLTSVVGAASLDQAYRQRSTDRFEATGVNVVPENWRESSGDPVVFDRNTIWRVQDQSRPWSLSIIDDNPKVDVAKERTATKLVQASRREAVYSTISGPLYSTVQRQTLSPFASVILPAIIPVSTTVFPEGTQP